MLRIHLAGSLACKVHLKDSSNHASITKLIVYNMTCSLLNQSDLVLNAAHGRKLFMEKCGTSHAHTHTTKHVRLSKKNGRA